MIALKIVVMVGIVAGLARSAPAIPITDGLIGYWPAEGNGADLSGFGRDLTLNGGLGFSAGLVGQAFNFHHNNAQYASRSVDDAAFDFGASDFTLQVWAKFNNFSDDHTLIEKFNGPGGPSRNAAGSFYTSMLTLEPWSWIRVRMFHCLGYRQTTGTTFLCVAAAAHLRCSLTVALL